jgi:alpha-ribazole phosphatase
LPKGIVRREPASFTPLPNLTLKTITFVRHGQSLANAGGITMAHDAIPLTELGRRQAKLLAENLELRPSEIWVSAYDRTGETAQPFCEKVGMRPRVHPDIHEFSTIDPDLLAGMNGEQRRPIADAYWRLADPSKRMGVHAETFEEFDARVGEFVARLDDLPNHALLFGHGMWFGLVTWKLLGFSAVDSLGMKAFRRFQLGLPMPNCACYELQRDDANWRVRVVEPVLRQIQSLALA